MSKSAPSQSPEPLAAIKPKMRPIPQMRPIIAILILTFLSSCSKEKTIYLKAKNAEGLKEESYLSLNGFEVGTIENITLNKQ